MTMRCTLAILLSLMLGITSQSMAVARGASAATGQMILCTGAGPVAVYTDAQGQPTNAPHLCPDSALNVLVEISTANVDVPELIVLNIPKFPLAAQHAPTRPHLGPPSRGPPLSV
jgi:hypothetical protein